jgi:hypothetical protein
MAEIKLTQGKVAIIDDEDAEQCSIYKWHAFRDKIRRPHIWYAATNVRNTQGRQIRLSLHRFLLGLTKGMRGDHVDGNGLNNRRLNIRQASSAQNSFNRKKQQNKMMTSQFKGVSKGQPRPRDPHPKWHAEITIAPRKIHLGFFLSEREAAQAYDCAAVLYFGRFARLNFPLEIAP